MRAQIFVIFLSLTCSGFVNLCDSTSLPSNYKPLYKLCVSELLLSQCKQMLNDVSVPEARLQCYPANDKVDCLEKMANRAADFIVIEPEDIYVAHELQHNFKVFAEVRSVPEDEFRYKPVAVVRNSIGIKSINDLKGKKSCHTGFGRNAGWKVPFSHLLDYGQLDCQSVSQVVSIERDLSAMSTYFSSGCSPGKWVPNDVFDAHLKRKYSKLCELCEKPRKCLESDKYAGYHGALACLVENGGDVAWTKLSAVYEYFRLQIPGQIAQSRPAISSHSDFSFLCPDGKLMNLTSQEPCSWAGRPWKAFLGAGHLESGEISEIQDQIKLYKEVAISEPNPQNWLNTILEISPSDKIINLDTPISASTYLDKGNYTVTIDKASCPTPKPIRICTKNPLEMKKCKHLTMAAKSRRIFPYFQCIEGENEGDCVEKIRDRQADIISLSPKDAFKYEVWQGREFVPIATELKWINLDDPEPYTYTVALVRSDSGINQISDLRGKRSCHGSIKSMDGWNNPLNILEKSGKMSDQNENEIDDNSCKSIQNMANFFGGSCIPGAFDPHMDLPMKIQNKFCLQCTGDTIGGISNHESYCMADESEKYFGNEGSLKCLEKLDGDVGFMNLNAFWHKTETYEFAENEEMLSTLYRLVCPEGNKTMDISDFRDCNWGKNPSNKIYMRRGHGKNELNFQEEVKIALYKLASFFAPTPKSPLQIAFRLFGHYESVPNILFEHSSVGFVDENTMKDENKKTDSLLRKYDSCKSADYYSSAQSLKISQVVVISVFLILIHYFK